MNFATVAQRGESTGLKVQGSFVRIEPVAPNPKYPVTGSLIKLRQAGDG